MGDECAIILEFSGISCLDDVHRMLRKRFDLPDYYGKNWDALWDCLNGRFEDQGHYVVELRGFYSMDDQLRDCCAPMLEIFRDLQEEAPNVRFVLVS